MAISAVSDAVKCRMLSSISQGAAMAWFMTLPQGSITKFRDLSSKFLVQFSTSEVEDLFEIRQRERETLKQYMERYSAASAKFEESEPRTCVCAFKNGFSPGELNCELSRKPARSMAEVRARASVDILKEEDDAHKTKRMRVEKVRNVSLARERIHDKEANSMRKDKEVEQFVGKLKGKQLCSRKKNIERQRPRRTTNLHRRRKPEKCSNDELTKLLQEVEVTPTGEDGKCEIDSRRGAKGRSKWCEYHNLESHDTGDCFTLKSQVRRMIRARRPRVIDHGPDRSQQDNRRRTPIASKGHTSAARRK
ncbi:uncharacterized protein LOC130719978 [Lotus japonicus]|uniref:uncharacterized protein LOC130719978 n=1 Tax=Lotus japonicus TaxID=34305 RepID=UPI002590629E|nr:uncharacterized protein LOC130719978 [Lotus japonicus]